MKHTVLLWDGMPVQRLSSLRFRIKKCLIQVDAVDHSESLIRISSSAVLKVSMEIVDCIRLFNFWGLLFTKTRHKASGFSRGDIRRADA